MVKNIEVIPLSQYAKAIKYILEEKVIFPQGSVTLDI